MKRTNVFLWVLIVAVMLFPLFPGRVLAAGERSKAVELLVQGEKYERRGKYERARTSYEVALSYAKFAFASDDLVGEAYGKLIALGMKSGQCDLADQYLKEESASSKRYRQDADRAGLYDELGDCYSKAGRPDQAVAVYREAQKIFNILGARQRESEVGAKIQQASTAPREIKPVVAETPKEAQKQVQAEAEAPQIAEKPEVTPSATPVEPKAKEKKAVPKEKEKKPAEQEAPTAVTSAPAPKAEPAAGSQEEMVYISSGEFQMGSNNGDKDETPVHPVLVDGFYIDKYEVANRRFEKFVKESGYRATGSWRKHFSAGKEDFPVREVTWEDASAYAKWAGKRLPTEAEWERAARGSSGFVFSLGNEYKTDLARTGVGYKDGPVKVGNYPPNEFGLYDMTGNVLEWCEDWFDPDYYSKSPKQSPGGPEKGKMKVLRGGAWDDDAISSRATNRFSNKPDRSLYCYGFRCARSK
jgi:formylglycine-generating enzyme required for sulfatase activity